MKFNNGRSTHGVSVSSRGERIVDHFWCMHIAYKVGHACCVDSYWHTWDPGHYTMQSICVLFAVLKTTIFSFYAGVFLFSVSSHETTQGPNCTGCVNSYRYTWDPIYHYQSTYLLSVLETYKDPIVLVVWTCSYRHTWDPIYIYHYQSTCLLFAVL